MTDDAPEPPENFISKLLHKVEKKGGWEMIGPFLGFLSALVMLAVGGYYCIRSVYRRETDEATAKAIAEAAAKSLAAKQLVAPPPISIEELSKLIETIMKIQNPSMQVGVFLVVFGIVVMIISIFIPF